MKGDPHDFMRIGIVHFMAWPRVIGGRGPILGSLAELCGDDYFQLIELTQIRRRSVRDEAREMIRSAGKAVAFCAQPVFLRDSLDLSVADPDEHNRVLDLVKKVLEEAAEWNAMYFEVLSGPDPGADARPESAVRLISSLKELCEASRVRRGPAVLLESFDRQPFGKNRLIGPTREAVDVARCVAPYYPPFGLLLDLSHLPLLSETPADAVRAAADYLEHVHIGNCVMRNPKHPAYGDEHPPFGTAESEIGQDQLAAFLRGLFEVGYLREGTKNTVSFEVKPLKKQSTAEALDICKKTLSKAWEMV